MKRNTAFCAIVCLAICLLGASCLAQPSGKIGPELRHWIEDPAQGLLALREGRIADLPKAPSMTAKSAPPPAAPVLSKKAVEIAFADSGIEAAVRAQLNRPTGPVFDTDVVAITFLDAPRRGVQSLADLQHMPNLKRLHLQDNKLASLADLPLLNHLSELYLDGNQITSFAGTPSLPELGRLHARHNRIGTLAGMPSLPVLWELFLENNQLVSLTGMPELPNLGRLNLAYNQLTGVAGLPNQMDMGYLNLSGNALQSLAGMPKYRSMNTLDISFNQLTTAQGLYTATSILQLYAEHNQLESLAVISQLGGLQVLSVGANRLRSLADAPFSPDVRDLDVSQNQLSSLAGVENYPNLLRLNAAGNCLQSLGVLAGLGRLYWMSLAGNGLASLADFPRMPGLQSLDLSCNQLTTLADMGDTPLLANLEARFNQLQALDPGFRPTLGYFGVSSNGLTSLASLNGANTPYLFMIDASFNHLRSLQGVENMPSLTAIAARGNQIESLAALSQNPQLNWLDVSSNQLTAFDNLPSNPPLAWLNASRNQIASLQGLAAAANIYLTRLDVSHNLLTSVAEIAAADQLYSLDISDNQVTDAAPLAGRHWQEMGIANNPTGDVQSVLFNNAPAPSIMSVGPGQLPSLAPFDTHYIYSGVIHASGPEYADLSLLGRARPTELRVSEAAVSSLAGLAASFNLYGGMIPLLALPNNALSDLSPLANFSMTRLDVHGNSIADVSPVTSDYLIEDWMRAGIQYLNVASNPVGSLAPALGRNLAREYFPPIGANIFWEYAWEQFGMTPEQAHNCLTFDPVVDVTDTPVAAAPEVAQLRADGVKVRTDGTCQYCQGACVPPVRVAVPEVTGMTQEAASAALAAAGLAAGTVAQQCSDSVPAGSVISQDPASGTTVDAGSSVALVVALGPCTVPVTVPNVVGQSPSDAIAAVQAAGLLVGTLAQQHSDTVPAGAVAAQTPVGGSSVPHGTAVALVISLGPNSPEGEDEPEGESRPPLIETVQALHDAFAAADTDLDGRLTLAEAQAAQPGLTAEEFALMDRNGDGVLSKEELDAFLGGPHEGGGCHGGGCHGGGSGWGGLGILLLSLLGLGILGWPMRS